MPNYLMLSGCVDVHRRFTNTTNTTIADNGDNEDFYFKQLN